MKVYNVRVGAKSLTPISIKSFTSLNDALHEYSRWHPNQEKELNEKDTLNLYHYKVVLTTVERG